MKAPYNFKVYSLIKGYWVLWGVSRFRDVHGDTTAPSISSSFDPILGKPKSLLQSENTNQRVWV